MDSYLIESVAEATDISLGPLARFRVETDNIWHRLRQAAQRRAEQSRFLNNNWRIQRVICANRACIAAVLWHRPPVFWVPIGGVRPLWMIEALSSHFPGERALFFLLAYWSLENARGVEEIRKNAELHTRRFPSHRLIFLCNSSLEQKFLDAAGLEAVSVHQNQIVSEQTFHPLCDTNVIYDAVYNAKIARFKRHYLAADVERLLYVAYRCPNDMSRSAGRAYVRRMLENSPKHQFANRLINGLPSPLSREEVNHAYNQASVGLCLSPVEGAMYASIEYLLAGLPVVTTPSQGGRDAFFDAEFCVTAEPKIRAIRDAVVGLRDRLIPRSIVRDRTIARIELERRRSKLVIERLLEQHGFEGGMIWPPQHGIDALISAGVRDHISRWRAMNSSTNNATPA